MSIYYCSKGHASTESDFCSECGAKIQGIPELASIEKSFASAVPPASVPVVQHCPDCSTPYEPDSGEFCEICGYNFITGAHGEVPPVPITLSPATGSTDQAATISISEETSAPDLFTSCSPSARTSEETAIAVSVVATIDPSLYSEGSPEAPTNQAPITFRLDKQSNLIGRNSKLRGIHPEVALDFDDGVSHRHALLNRQPDGTFILRDIGSANGTKLNGVELAAMIDATLKDGDEFTLGHWTRVTLNKETLGALGSNQTGIGDPT